MLWINLLTGKFYKSYFVLFIRWKLPNIVNLVGDSAFGKKESINKVNKWNGFATFSCVQEGSLWLLNSLKHCVPPKHWRAAVNPEGWIASLHTIIDKTGKIVTQQIYSNSFDAVHLTSDFFECKNQTQIQIKMKIFLSTATTKVLLFSIDLNILVIPIYDKDTLETLNIPELTTICKEYNINHGKIKL